MLVLSPYINPNKKQNQRRLLQQRNGKPKGQEKKKKKLQDKINGRMNSAQKDKITLLTQLNNKIFQAFIYIYIYCRFSDQYNSIVETSINILELFYS